MESRKNRATIENDERIAIQKFRSDALKNNINSFFLIQTVSESLDGEGLKQAIAVTSKVSTSIMNKLGFGTSVRKQVFDGSGWAETVLYTSFTKEISNRFILMSNEDFAVYLSKMPKQMKKSLMQARKNAFRLLTI